MLPPSSSSPLPSSLAEALPELAALMPERGELRLGRTPLLELGAEMGVVGLEIDPAFLDRAEALK